MAQGVLRLLSAGIVALALTALAGTTEAGKPQDDNGDFLGNGFPSGPHFNLNLLGKKDNFTCPAPEFLVITDNSGDGDEGTSQTQAECDAEGDLCGDQVFGNVVFMPRKDDPQGSNFTDPITLLFESGRKGPRNNPSAVELEVSDWCTESFPDFGDNGPGDGATIRLPKDPEGYAVYARITGKPGGPATFTFQDRELKLVQDQFGNDLLLLGFVNEDGAFDPTGVQLTRFDTARKGKGVVKATDITALFQFVGTVCNINDTAELCLDANGDDQCVDRLDPDGSGLVKPVCCVGANLDTNGDVVVADFCPPDSDGFAFCQDNASLAEVAGDLIGDDDGVCEEGEDCVFACQTDIVVEDPAGSNDGDGVCEEGEDCLTAPSDIELCEVVPQCRTFTEADGQWIFNIADFVDLELNTENQGSYNVQLRFYPLPLDIGAQ